MPKTTNQLLEELSHLTSEYFRLDGTYKLLTDAQAKREIESRIQLIINEHESKRDEIYKIANMHTNTISMEIEIRKQVKND